MTLKIVLDTNMFLSAILYGGMVKTIFDLVLDNKLELYVSPDLKTEVLKKLMELGASEEIMLEASIFLNIKGVSIVPNIDVTVCRDPEDNYLLELAEASRADYIITRDKDLLELPQNAWKETKIIKPEEFLPMLRKMELAPED